MPIPAVALIAAIAALHLYIAWFEIFAWESRGPKIFKQFPRDMFKPTRALAANQGIYNAFLAVGLLWSLIIDDPIWATRIATCFLLFVLTAGVFGGFTASRRIFYVQALPAALAILLLWVM